MSYANTIWTTELVEESIEKVKRGVYADKGCFFEGDFSLRASKINFHLTAYEYEEYEKCASDIIYFTEHYAKFLTDAGPRLVDLRKYQVKYLNTLADQVWVDDIQDFGPKNRNFINCWSRQTSKCLGIDAKSLIKDDITSEEKIANLALLYYENKKRLTVLEKIKVWLIKLYNKLD